MICDGLLLFSDSQTVTAAAASDSYVDAGIARNIGVGQDLYVVVTVDEALTDGSSDSTVDVYLYGDSSTSFTPDGKQKLFTIPALAAAGARYVAKISPDFASNYRYMELYYDVQSGNLSTGKFTASIVVNLDGYTSYAKGYTIS